MTLGRRAALVGGVTSLLVGCMDHTTHLETVPVGRSLRQIPEPAPVEQAYVVLDASPSGVRVQARAQATCRQELLVLSRTDQVTDIRASSARWVGAAALFGAAALSFAMRPKGASAGDSAGVPLAFAAGGTAVVIAPELGARTKRRTLGYEQDVLPAPRAPCADHPLGGIRVAVRDARGTHEATTDASGAAVLPDSDAASVREAYVNDLVVPVRGR